ncbi:hypothetical protein Bca4012_009656 [Brassica carinata]
MLLRKECKKTPKNSLYKALDAESPLLPPSSAMNSVQLSEPEPPEPPDSPLFPVRVSFSGSSSFPERPSPTD